MDRGRPRAFDLDAALDRALVVFWRNGFQGASLSELTEAMGVSKPSLYAAFGDKEGLYLRALERYRTRIGGPKIAVLEAEPDGRRAIERFLRGIVDSMSDPALPGGCLLVNSAPCGIGLTPPSVQAGLREAWASEQRHLSKRLRRAQADGHLDPGADVDTLALFFVSFLNGIGVLARSGENAERLKATVAAAMLTWPEPAKKPAPRAKRPRSK